jgi:hypothetical protein
MVISSGFTFFSNARGSKRPERLKERFPDEMTVVLQEQILGIGVRGRSGTIAFNQIPAMIPYAAFVDPAVDFGRSSRRHQATDRQRRETKLNATMLAQLTAGWRVGSTS